VSGQRLLYRLGSGLGSGLGLGSYSLSFSGCALKLTLLTVGLSNLWTIDTEQWRLASGIADYTMWTVYGQRVSPSVRVAVSLRLGLNLCQCGSPVEAWGIHALVYKRASGRFAIHHALSDTISRALVSAEIPALKEPTGLSRSDGRRPDGLTLIPWQRGRPLV